jgi:hypothetical protein
MCTKGCPQSLPSDGKKGSRQPRNEDPAPKWGSDYERVGVQNDRQREDFDGAGEEEMEPGTVMVITEDGGLQQSDQEYDKKVADVVSGAGDYNRPLFWAGSGRAKVGSR